MPFNTPPQFLGSTTFTVNGMTCSQCERALTQEICGIAGVDSVRIDGPTGTVTVTAYERVDPADVAAAVEEAGYALAP